MYLAKKARTSLLKRVVGVVAALILLLGTLPIAALAIDDVTGLTATAGEGEVSLSWTPVAEAATYNVYMGTQAVGPNESYNMETQSTNGTASQFVATGLDNGTEYFFSVTAIDPEGTESLNFSSEVSATPEGDSVIEEVTSPNNTTIEVATKEALELVLDDEDKQLAAAEYVTITYLFDNSNVEVTAIEVSADKLTFTTSELVTGGEHEIEFSENVLVAGSQQALAESERTQIVIAGAGDSLDAPEEPVNPGPEPKEGAPAITSAVANGSEITVSFDEPVKLPTTEPESAFSIINNDNPSQFLDVTNAEFRDGNFTEVFLTIADPAPGTYTLVVTRVTDTEGTALGEDGGVVEFIIGSGSVDPTPGDTEAPEDGSNLNAVVDNLETLAVALTWSQSPNTAGDLARYVVYVRKQGEDFTKQTEVPFSESNAQATLKEVINGLDAETTYDFRVTAVDANNNESAGIEATLTLPETGPGLGLLAIGSLAAARRFSRRKRD